MADTLCDVLESHADVRGPVIALTVVRDGSEVIEQISYRALHQRAQAVAAVLQAKHLQGHCAVLLYPSGIEFVSTFLGCLYAGVIAVPAPPPDPSRLKRAMPRLNGIVKDCNASIVLTDTSVGALSVSELDQGYSSLEWIATDAILGETHRNWQPVPLDPQAVCYLQYTSGSTSSPKGIEISHFNLLYQLKYLQQTCSYDQKSISITWMPNYHDWGLVEGILEPLYNGTPAFIMSPISFVRRPKNWLEAISRFRGTHSQGPTFAYDHCWRRIPLDQIDDLDLRSWRAAGIAAEPINFATMQNFYEKFRSCGFRWTTFSPAYGLGEATLKVSCCVEDVAPSALILDAERLEKNQAVLATDKSANVRTVVSSGSAYGETKIAIADPETFRRLRDGEVGEIWIHDPAVALGYWNLAEESELIFRARLADGHGPFLRTGDLGFLREEKLYVTGRLKDLIIVRGSNHYPQDIEWTAQGAHEALAGQTSAAFAIEHDGTEKLVLLQELSSSDWEQAELTRLISAVVAKVSECHELDVFDLLLLKRGTIPKTASGKVQRRASRQIYLDSGFDCLARRRSPLLREAEAIGNVMNEELRVAAATRSSLEDQIAKSAGIAQDLVAWLREYANKRINSFIIDQRRCVPPYIVLDFGNKGIFGLQVPTEYGGLGLSYRDTALVLEQLAAIDVSLATLVFLSNTNGLRPIINYGSEDTKNALLPGLAAGRQLAAFALSEPGAGSNIGAIQTKAVRQGANGWLLSGVKRWNGSAWADVITVIAREFAANGDSMGVSAFLVKQGTAGLQVGEESLTVGLRGIVQNSLRLDHVQVDKGSLLGTSGDGWAVVNDALSVGRLCAAAVCLGGMKRASQMLLRYARARDIASGRLLDHPNTQYRLAEITCRIEAIGHTVNHLARGFDANCESDLWKSVSPLLTMAVKLRASEFFSRATEWAVQLLGGRGYMENNEAPRLFRDARSLSIGEGPNESLTGFLGQSQNIEVLVRWLESLSAKRAAEQLAAACADVRERCAQRKDLSVGQRRLWSDSLCGEIAADSILHAMVESESVLAEKSTLSDWTGVSVRRTIVDSLFKAEQVVGLHPSASIEETIDGFRQDIGDIVQTLPGEDQTLDPLLSTPQPVDLYRAVPSAGELPDQENNLPSSDQKRLLLKELLAAKASQGKN